MSVKDRLPGTEIDWCIVFAIDRNWTTFAFMARYDNKNNEWDYFDDDKDYEKTMTVTHWMPLPEIPI